MITSKELCRKYIDFFKEKGHIEIPSASLVPEHDPTVLFTTAGMHPLVPYLMGEKHPGGKRLVNVQKCIRTVDIEDVGDSTHNTFFEMLGNWSLGDYFKDNSIRWSWEFLTDKKWLGIDPKKIKVTVFEGDNDAPRDNKSIEIWQECFKKSEIEGEIYNKAKKNSKTARIFPLPKEDNWWEPAGITGPCGPDTEIFIDLGKSINFEKCPSGDDCKPGCKCGRYVEIWNNVFMEYNKTVEGKYIPLAQKNVDTGMGMERTLAILNGFDNVYQTDVLAPIVAQVQSSKHALEMHRGFKVQSEIQNSKLDIEEIKSIRIIADHIRAAVFMISDGVIPSNLDRGYVLRRLLRRAIRYENLLKMPNGFLSPLAETVIDIYKEFYPELERNKDKILDKIGKEEKKFERTLERGIKKLHLIFLKYVKTSAGITIPRIDFEKKAREIGREFFDLYQSDGLPVEVSLEEIKSYFDKEFSFKDEIIKSFKEELQKHQELSRTAAAGKFKGGLADAGEQTTKYHTATHLLLASLRKVLGEHIYQKGSNITAERLRFDFSYLEKLTDEQKKKVEDIVNEQIQKNIPVSFEEMSLEEAKRLGAMGVFESKYGEKVKVYTIGNEKSGIFSREICGGPHIKNTGELGKFKIKKEESSSTGVRRIKAVLE